MSSIDLKKVDSRCRGWTKIVPAYTRLPLPSAVSGAADLPAKYTIQGTDEIAPGDCAFWAEEVSHNKPRGWTYATGVSFDDDAKATFLRLPAIEVKAQLKALGRRDLLAGAGQLACEVRAAWLYRIMTGHGAV
jgi:hypothetical protein